MQDRAPTRRDVLGWLAVAPLACGRLAERAPPPAEGASPPGSAAPVAPAPAELSLEPDRLDLRAEALRRTHPGMHVLVEEPFVVVGEAAPERVQRYAEDVIRWAVDRLREAYFDRDPSEVIDVWLLETAASYEHHARDLFGDRPDTPYGYYTARHHALIMNIATGGGTLVHEIVHPFMETNFPACPSWFNEGLASLYEQSADRDGRIVGLTNWRLSGLQEALRRGQVPRFETLCTSGEGFYSADPGTNYAQARYLCYWLQEHDLLRDYYRDFRRDHATDPSGHATLARLVGGDMMAFRREWEGFVKKLRYPG